MITFGRFSDSFKPKAKIDEWNLSEKQFLEKNYLESYEAFLRYLRDDETGNVQFSRKGERIDFELQQGSKKVTGYIAQGRVICEADIAGYEKLSVSFMRRLMEMNYSLLYSRFALKDNRICIKFDSKIPAAPPRKLYYGWKELATRADKQDDLLEDDFVMLKSIRNMNIQQIPESEKEIKYSFYKKWIEKTINKISGLNEDAFSGGISYLLLNTAYKIDYFIAPEGTLMNEIEKLSWAYFVKDNRPVTEKNLKMKEALQKLFDKPKDTVLKDLYRVKSTFGIANPAPHQAVLDLFANNLQNVKWYIDNNHSDIAVNIYEYLATYCLFSYGLPRPDVKLFHLMLNISNQDYFTALGISPVLYDSVTGKLNDTEIKSIITSIISSGNELYPDLKFNTDNLKFDSLLDFLRTFIEKMKTLNFNQ